MAGFREFLTGEVLTSENVNNFLMKQSVMVFVDDAARTAALGAEVAEGMLTYNLDTDQLEVHDGSAFVSVASPPTTNASLLTSGTLAAARLPAGTVLQVARASRTTTLSTTTNAFVEIVAVTITPQFSNSVIVVTAMTPSARDNDVHSYFLTLFRGATNLANPTSPGSRTASLFGHHRGTGQAINMAFVPFMQVFDSPATTSAVTYSAQILTRGGLATVNMSTNDGNTNQTPRGVSTIIAMEVKV